MKKRVLMQFDDEHTHINIANSRDIFIRSDEEISNRRSKEPLPLLSLNF